MLKDRHSGKLFPTNQFGEEEYQSKHSDQEGTSGKIIGQTIDVEQRQSTVHECQERHGKQCDSEDCMQRQNQILNWIQCAGCSKWYHY